MVPDYKYVPPIDDILTSIRTHINDIGIIIHFLKMVVDNDESIRVLLSETTDDPRLHHTIVSVLTDLKYNENI